MGVCFPLLTRGFIMFQKKLLVRFVDRQFLSTIVVAAFLLALLFSAESFAQANKDNKTKTIREVAQYFIKAGKEQYERQMYARSEKSFLRAQDYEEYLTASTRESLDALLDKAHHAVLERKKLSERIKKADELIKLGQLVKAKTHLEDVKASEFLNEEE